MMQSPMMVGPATAPLLQPQSVVPYAQPYAPVPITVVPPTMPAAPTGPVQSNTTSQSVVINQPGSDDKNKKLLVDPDGVRDWTTGLCGCLNDIVSCACACFCSPLLLCRVANRMKECAFISCVVPGGFMGLRVKLRTMGGIKGNICEDCLVTHFCPLCAACQMSRELDAMGL